MAGNIILGNNNFVPNTVSNFAAIACNNQEFDATYTDKVSIKDDSILIDSAAIHTTLPTYTVVRAKGVTKTSDFTTDYNNNYYFIDASSGNIAVTLSADDIEHVFFRVDNTANTIVITPAFGNINGASSYALVDQYEYVGIYAFTTEYYITRSGVGASNNMEATNDAAGRLRTSSLSTFGEYKILNNVFPSLLLEKSGTATFTNNNNRVTMSVTSGKYGIISSKQYHPYFNGRSQIIEFTAAGMGSGLNVEKSFGYISTTAASPGVALDGFRIFKDTSDDYYFQVWRNGSNTVNAIRSTWHDRLNGSGPSGMNINWDNFNVFMFDFLYLGGTALRMFVMYNGAFRLVHTYYHANNDLEPIFRSPNKPIHYEIKSTTGSGSMDFICCMVGCEGGAINQGTSISVSAPIAGISPLAVGTTYAMCGIRKASTQRDIYAQIESFDGLVSTTNDYINVELRLNPTVAGTFNYSAVSNTPLESAVGAITNTVTGGTVIDNAYFSSATGSHKMVNSILAHLNSSLANVMDEIVLCATPALGSTNVKATASMNIQWYNQ